MRKRIFQLLGVATLAALAICGSANAATTEMPGFQIEDVVSAIKDQIRVAQASETGLPRLRIDKVEVELTAVATINGQAGIEFKVPVFDASFTQGVKQQSTQHLSLVLLPLTSSEVASYQDLGLVSALQHVKQALRGAINNPPEMRLDNFVFRTSFAVTQTASGEIRFLIIDVGGGGEYAFTNQMTIYFSLANH